MSYQPRNVLVTGGAGFIGANFIRHWLTQDIAPRIINVDLLTYAGSLDNLRDLPQTDQHIFIQGNIIDATLIKTLLRQYEIDTIVHFAAESHVDRSITGPKAFIETNVMGTFSLLEAAKQYWVQEKKWDATACRFHHISTDEVYGSLTREDPACHEETPYAPNSPYSASKASADHWVRAYHHTYGLPVTMSHCSNNYGPYQHPEKLMPTVIVACAQQKTIPIYGDGSNIRDWIYVDDHCLGLLTILKHGKVGRTYNLGGDCEQSNIAVAQQICGLMDEIHPQAKPHAELIQFVTDRPGHDWRYAINSHRIKNELGWMPQENFANGLRKTILFFLSGKMC